MSSRSYRSSRSKRSRSSTRPSRYMSRARSVAPPPRRALAAQAVELKHFDQCTNPSNMVELSNNPDMSQMAGINPSGTGCLFAPTMGNGSGQREGRLATVHSVYVSGLVRNPSWVSDNSGHDCTVFLALVLDRSPNTDSIEGSTNLIYRNGASTGDPLVYNRDYSVTPLRNLEWSKRFKVLKTKTITFNPTGSIGGAMSQERTFTLSYRPSGSDAQVEFQGNDGTIASVTKNAYYIIGITNSTRSGASLPAIAYNCRVRFVG